MKRCLRTEDMLPTPGAGDTHLARDRQGPEAPGVCVDTRGSDVLVARTQFRLYVAEQHQGLSKLQGLMDKYASPWAAWGGAGDVADLLALSRGNMLRTNAISSDLMRVMPSETRARLGMGESAYFELAQSWATRTIPEGTAGVVRDLDAWKAPVSEGVRRACAVIGARDPVHWTRRVGVMNHEGVIDNWLAQLDTAGGMSGPSLRNLSAFVREFYVGAVASVATYMDSLAPGCGRHELPRASASRAKLRREHAHADA